MEAKGPIEDLIEDLVERAVEQKLAEQVPRLRLVSKQKLADSLGVKERTIKTLRAKGMPGYRVGREVFYDVDETEAWLRRQAA